jgi:DNA helicase-2/ATP-dependent DNA helicase PcrA
MRRLYLTYAEQRRLHGVDQFGTPSRFVAEIPAELVEEVRPRVQVSRPLYSSDARFGGRPGGTGGAAPARGRSSEAYPGARDPGRYVEPPSGGAGMRLGQRVRHARFGEGVVMRVDGQGQGAQVEVNFERIGRKVLMLAYANLESI